MGFTNLDEVGTVVAINGPKVHSIGVVFDRQIDVGHELMIFPSSASYSGVLMMEGVFEWDDEAQTYTLPELQYNSGYWFHEDYIEHLEFKYDPMQQGDKDDDI